ncbi:MAG: ParA family protein [Oceanococcaceae bacterium]
MRRVVFNQKGGVGKTTIVCNLAALAAARGLRTLVIDLDIQGNSTRYLTGDDVPDRSVADFFEGTLRFGRGDADLAQCISPTPFERLDVVAASAELDHLMGKLEAKQKVHKLRQALEKLSGYDAVYIDTPPALNFYSRSALIAAQRVLIPFDCDDFARQALYTLLDNIAEIQADHNDTLNVEGIIVNQFNAQARLPRELLAILIDEGLPVRQPPLSASVKIKESHEAFLPMVHYAPRHKLTEQFEALYGALNSTRGSR